MAILAVGIVGTFVELLLLAHYEEAWQWSPLVLIVVAAIALAWHVARRSAASVRALQAVMTLFIVAGFLGIGLHLDGAAEFQREIDRSQPGWQIFKKALQAQAPPALAPGIMIQLGLLGLASVYRHPAVRE